MSKSLELKVVTVSYGSENKYGYNIEDLEKLFDDDFTTNEDEFRGDTLELGYKNEFYRIINEHIAENRKLGFSENELIQIGEILSIAYHSSYYLEYTYEITDIPTEYGIEKVISIAMLTQ